MRRPRGQAEETEAWPALVGGLMGWRQKEVEAGLRAAGSLVGHGTQFQFYSKATGSLWWVISKEASESDLHF